MDGWVMYFNVFFNSISVISGRWAVGNERVCVMQLNLQLTRSSPQVYKNKEINDNNNNNAVELQRLEHFWNHENMFETEVVR